MNCLNFTFSSGKEHCQLRFSPPQIELVDKPGKRERAYLVCRDNISIIKTILVGWREGKWSPTSYTTMKTLMIPTGALWGCTNCTWAYVQRIVQWTWFDAFTNSICYLLVFQPAISIPWTLQVNWIPGYKTKPSLPSHCCNMTVWLRDRQAVGYGDYWTLQYRRCSYLHKDIWNPASSSVGHAVQRRHAFNTLSFPKTSIL